MALVITLVSCLCGPVSSAAESSVLGVLAFRGKPETLRRWQPTVDYLNASIAEQTFVLRALNQSELRAAVAANELDFVLTNTGSYISLESRYGISRVLTLVNRVEGKPQTRFGAVIFSRADHPSIRQLRDLRDAVFGGVSRRAFGGFQMAWDELERHGVDPFVDMERVDFFGLPQDQIVRAVLSGEVDAGTVRTGVLEHMAAGGEIALADVRVLGARTSRGFDLLHSTELYPEWPLAAAPHVDRHLAESVARALLAMPADSLATRSAAVAGWTVPLDYSPAHRLMQRLKVGPYAVQQALHWRDVLEKYWPWVVSASLLVVLLLAILVVIGTLHARVLSGRRALRAAVAEAQRAQGLAEGILVSLPSHVAVLEGDGAIIHVNDAWRIFATENGASPEEFSVGCNYVAVCDEAAQRGDRSAAEAAAGIRAVLSSRSGEFTLEYACHSPTEQRWFLMSVAPLQGKESGAVVSHTNITDRVRMENRLREEKDEQARLLTEVEKAQQQLLQSEKMASIGQLAAGVAHEINNPVGYVCSNLGTLESYIGDILKLIDEYEELETTTEISSLNLQALKRLKQEIQLDYLRQDLRELVDESQEGVARVKQIVQDLKDFSHVREAEWEWADIHKGLDSTLNIVHNELKYKAEVVKDYGRMNEVRCVPSQINQIFMNLLVNAAQAIDTRGTIKVSSGMDGTDWGWVEIADDGKGIDEADIKRLFDPFFTTKPVGEGTGLGLSLAYSIAQRHGGRILVHSEKGKGSRFRLLLPVTGPETVDKSESLPALREAG